MTDLIVEARGVQKFYEAGAVRVDALRSVDLEVTRGEMVAIMGPSGCGKTTLASDSSSSPGSSRSRRSSSGPPWDWR